MTEEGVMTKAALVAALRASGEEALAALRVLPAEAFELDRYENGRNGRQILAHVASMEWTYPRLLDIPSQPSPPESERPSASFSGGNDGYNARQVERRADATIAALLDEFARNRAATIAAVEAADEVLLRQPIRSAGGASGPLANVFNEVAVEHVRQHLGDILRS